MKVEIMNALKTEYANMGLSERAIDGVASFLEKTVTEEGQIDSAIKEEGVKNLLKSFQGDADSARNRFAALQKELDDYKKAHPETKKEEKEEPEDDSKLKAVMDEIAALKNSLAEKDKALSRKELLEGVRASMRDQVSKNAVLELALKEVEIADGDTVESIVGKVKPKYDSLYTSLYGETPVPPVGAPGASSYKSGDDAKYIQHLRETGKLPAENK